MSRHVAEQVCNAKIPPPRSAIEVVIFFFLLCSQSPESARIESAEESSKQGKVTRLKAIYLLKVRRHCQRAQSERKQSRRKAAGKVPRGVGWGPPCWLRPGRFGSLRGAGLLWGSLSLSLSPGSHSALPALCLFPRCGMRVCVCVCTSLSLSPPPPLPPLCL